jgi:hypothetical protein
MDDQDEEQGTRNKAGMTWRMREDFADWNWDVPPIDLNKFAAGAAAIALREFFSDLDFSPRSQDGHWLLEFSSWIDSGFSAGFSVPFSHLIDEIVEDDLETTVRLGMWEAEELDVMIADMEAGLARIKTLRKEMAEADAGA